MRMTKEIGQEGQIVMFVVFVIIFMMLFIGLFITRTLVKQAKTADNIVSSVQAFYIADSGAEFALNRVMNHCGATETPSSCIPDYGDAEFGSASDCRITTGTGLIFYITGTYRGQTSRAIQLTFPSTP